MAIFQSLKSIFQRPTYPGKTKKFRRKSDVRHISQRFSNMQEFTQSATQNPKQSELFALGRSNFVDHAAWPKIDLLPGFWGAFLSIRLGRTRKEHRVHRIFFGLDPKGYHSQCSGLGPTEQEEQGVASPLC